MDMSVFFIFMVIEKIGKKTGELEIIAKLSMQF